MKERPEPSTRLDTTPGRVAAILLAAGSGSRFGWARGAKLLAGFRGAPLVSHAMEALARAPVDEVFVVVGDGSGEISFLCERYGYHVVENPDADRGQATSVLAGLRAVRESGEFGAFVVVLGDQPLVGGEAVRRLVGAFRDGARVAVATYSGKPRNPVLFSRGVWDDLEGGMAGDEGARSFLRSRWDLVVEVECGDSGSASDVDTVDDLESLESGPEMSEKRRDA